MVDAIFQGFLVFGLFFPAFSEVMPKYIGCFSVEYEPNLSKWKEYFKSDDLVPDDCLTYCYKKGYQHYGLQFKEYCRCDKEYTKVKEQSSECDSNCAGDATQGCGGFWNADIYEIIEVNTGPGNISCSSSQVCPTVSTVTTTMFNSPSNSFDTLTVTESNHCSSIDCTEETIFSSATDCFHTLTIIESDHCSPVSCSDFSISTETVLSATIGYSFAPSDASSFTQTIYSSPMSSLNESTIITVSVTTTIQATESKMCAPNCRISPVPSTVINADGKPVLMSLICRDVIVVTNTSVQASEARSSVIEELSIYKKNLTAVISKKISAEDSRPSAKTLGYLGITFFLIPIMIIVSSDLTYLFQLRHQLLNRI